MRQISPYDIKVVCDHTNNVHPDMLKDIFEHIQKGWPFVLTCDVSAVIFIPSTLRAIWVPGGAIEQCNSMKSFIDAVNLQLVSHFTFTSLRQHPIFMLGMKDNPLLSDS